MIRAPSALDVLLKKEAEPVPKISALPKNSAAKSAEPKALPKISAATSEKHDDAFNAIVDNTVALFHAYRTKHEH